MKTYKGKLSKGNMPTNGVFVFGSNTEGRHGLGAADMAARSFGAKYGQARGRQGQSYAIVTKDLTKQLHPSVNHNDIIKEIKKLYFDAAASQHEDYYIAYRSTGTNLNGYNNQDMAHMFAAASNQNNEIPENIVFEEGFAELVKIGLDFKRRADGLLSVLKQDPLFEVRAEYGKLLMIHLGDMTVEQRRRKRELADILIEAEKAKQEQKGEQTNG